MTNNRKILKCVAGEGRRISVGPIVWETKYYRESSGKGISYLQ